MVSSPALHPEGANVSLPSGGSGGGQKVTPSSMEVVGGGSGGGSGGGGTVGGRMALGDIANVPKVSLTYIYARM